VEKHFLENDSEFNLLEWPAQSADLNPIEHVSPSNLQQLRYAIVSAWTNISVEHFDTL
jgi:hypothetical protein